MYGYRCLVAATLGAAMAWCPPAAAQTIVLVGSESAAPRCYPEQGEAKGTVLEVTREALKRAGFKPEVELMPFKRAYEETLRGGGNLMLTCIYRSKERDALFLMSDSVADEEIVAVTLKGHEFPVKTYADLAGKTVAVQHGGSLGPAFEDAKARFAVEGDPNPVARLRKLLAGRVDVAVLGGGAASLKYYARQGNLPLSSFSVAGVLDVAPNYAAVSRTSGEAGAAIIRRFNKGLAEIKADGTYQSILRKYR